MKLSSTIVLWLFSLCWAISAQQTASKLPKCAQACLATAFLTKTCAPTDQACICTNQNFQSNVSLCVAKTCTIPESLATKNISLTNCGAPVRDRGQNYVKISNPMAIVAAAFVVMRFTFKGFYSKLDIGWDDWAVLATLIASTPSAIITVYGTTKNGLGRDIWTLTPTEITNMLRFFYVMASLYFTQVALLKLTLIFFYIRVFPAPNVQRLLWGTVVFVVLWGFSYVIVAIFQCQPIHYFWTKWDGMHKGTCLQINVITASNAAISIALDFWILGIPLWQLWGLKMHWKKKVGVAMMFCVGTFVTVVSILRLQALVHFAASSNASWEFYDVSVWSTIEICVGIMCASLPTLRLLLVKLFPVLGGSSARSRANYYNYGSGTELKNVGNRSRTTDPGVSNSSRSGVLPTNQNITIKSTYTVEHTRGDTDEASLVSHENMKKEKA
ncbi:hypothetical protein GQ44DRAFT_163115 [Phaeosphaeriaceae sp. PMI808]|nr:hypothetical protein GQ44DRAFT_163115 [Phaeosphaeriaceae sp. PMI808]